MSDGGRDNVSSMLALDAPCYHPGAYIERMRVVVDGDYDGLVWGTRYIVLIPGIGSCGEYERVEDAFQHLAAYHNPEATIASVWRATGRKLSDHPLLAGQAGGRNV